MTKPPRRWLAALLSLVVPGTGQLYAGRVKRAAALLFAWGMTILLAGYSLLMIPPMYGVLISVAATLGFAIVAAMDAWRVASRWPLDLPRPAFTRWYVVLPVFLVAAYGIASLNGFRKAHLVEAFRNPTGAMEPTLLISEYFIVDKRPRARTPARGAVLIHESVEEPGQIVIKRVVALPHDTIAMQQGVLRLNGLAVDEPYLAPVGELSHADTAFQQQMRAWQLPHLVRHSDSLYLPDVNDWGPLVVPNDAVFTLGDNRNASYDSRYFGFVPYSHILGRARYIYLSRDSTGAVRWPRFGTPIR